MRQHQLGWQSIYLCVSLVIPNKQSRLERVREVKFRGALECNGDRHMTVLEAAQ
jgi:hypothetical protein